MVVGWPVFIMSLVILSGLDRQLNDGITVTDAYDYLGDCVVQSIDDSIVFPNVGPDRFGLIMIKCDLFANDGDIIRVKVYNGTSISDNYHIGDVTQYWKNRDASRVLIDDAPYVGWLRRPMERETCIDLIVVGCLLICAPITIACCFAGFS